PPSYAFLPSSLLRRGAHRHLHSFPTRRSSDLHTGRPEVGPWLRGWIDEDQPHTSVVWRRHLPVRIRGGVASDGEVEATPPRMRTDRKSTRLNSSHDQTSYAVFCLKKKNTISTS